MNWNKICEVRRDGAVERELNKPIREVEDIPLQSQFMMYLSWKYDPIEALKKYGEIKEGADWSVLVDEALFETKVEKKGVGSPEVVYQLLLEAHRAKQVYYDGLSEEEKIQEDKRVLERRAEDTPMPKILAQLLGDKR